MRKLIAVLAILFLARTADAGVSIVVYNQTTNTTVTASEADLVRPIASITKLMTAMVVLDSNQPLYEQLNLYSKLGSFLPARMYTREELLEAMLIKSDNAAAETLACADDRGRFLKAMNDRARALGMMNTHFDDPSGLGALNTSTARDLVLLVQAAARYPFIRAASVKKTAIIETKVKKQIRTIRLEHTSAPYLFQFENIQITKTGLTNAAGWCVALQVEQKGQIYQLIVLGSKTKQQRLDKVKDLMYNNVIDSNIYER